MKSLSPISNELSAMGFFFRERFLNSNLVSKNGWTLFGSPTISNGLVLNGTTQYGRVELPSTFHSSSVVIFERFTPTFAHDDGFAHYLFDSNPTGDYYVEKTAANALELYLGNTLIVSVAAGTYGSYWYQNLENILIVSGTDTDTSIWLNGQEIVSSDATSWTPTQPSQFTIGATHAGASFFAGTVHELMFGNLLLDDTSCPQLNAGTIISDISDKRSVASLALTEIQVDGGGVHYTPITGSATDKKALLGSDGLTLAEMPTKLPNGGLAFNGSQFVTILDAPEYTFSIPGGGDLPFTVCFVYKSGDPSAGSSGIISKYTSVGNGEWLIYQTASDLSIFLVDQSTSGYILVQTNAKLVKYETNTWVCTYDGSGANTGLTIYKNGILEPITVGSSGVYTQMRDSANIVFIGKNGINIMPAGSEVHLVDIKPYEMSEAQAKAWHQKAKALNRGR